MKYVELREFKISYQISFINHKRVSIVISFVRTSTEYNSSDTIEIE